MILGYCGIGKEGAIALGKALVQQQSLKGLYFGMIYIYLYL